MEINELYELYKESCLITTDTRLDLEGSMFFALKGENFNGNNYATKALDKGASYAVIDEKQHRTDARMILVDDVLKTLQKLATFHRKQLNIPIIALTGSNGKTTSKELIHAVLRQKYICTATKGNLNNHIGVPLTLLSIRENCEIGIIEMGANHANEIRDLCHIALPDFGYITNFGRVHLEGFGSLDGVIMAKTEMYEYLRSNGKKVFINYEDPIQVEKSLGMDLISFGSLRSDYNVKYVSADPNVLVHFEDISIHSNLIGKYNYSNIAIAITIGKYYSVSNGKIKKGIESYIPSNNRSQIIKKNSNQIILDAYNANPESMKAALENLGQLSVRNKVVILGDMFELGRTSLQDHEKIVEMINHLNIQKTILIGETFFNTVKSDPSIFRFKNIKEFEEHHKGSNYKNSTILIKASRGMALERVLDFI